MCLSRGESQSACERLGETLALREPRRPLGARPAFGQAVAVLTSCHSCHFTSSSPLEFASGEYYCFPPLPWLVHLFSSSESHSEARGIMLLLL